MISISVAISICCFMFMSVLSVFYFSKSRLNNFDNQIFSALMVINTVGIFIDLAGFISFKVLGSEHFINLLIAKVYLIYYLTYTFTLMIYVYNFATHNLKKAFSAFVSIFTMLVLVVFLLPISIHFENNIGYTFGVSVNLAYAIGFLFIAIMLGCLIKDRKHLRAKEYIPLFAFVILTLATVIVQKVAPEITLLLLANSIVTFLMYFTIENPDLKMIEELSNFNKLSERNNMDKESFLFNITQQVKSPLNSIQRCVDSIDEGDDAVTVKQKIKDVKIATENLQFIINSGLDISTLDASKIKIVESKYNINNLLNIISRKAKSEIEDKGLTFRTSVEAGIPELLYGDSIKVKQIINALISNSLKCTKEGFIELRVSALTKKDACRLYISVEDSGCGMRADEINKLYNKDSEEEKIQKSFDDENLDLLSIRKVVNFIGGTVMIESEVGNGTKVTVVLNQRVVNQEKSDVLQVIDTYDEIKSKEINILLIDDNKDEVKIEKKMLDQANTNLTIAKNGEEGLKLIRKENVYDIIFVSEKMEKLDGNMVMTKLKKIDGFDTPVILMSKVFDEKNKDAYLKTGFSDVIEKPLGLSKVKKVINIFVKK